MAFSFFLESQSTCAHKLAIPLLASVMVSYGIWPTLGWKFNFPQHYLYACTAFCQAFPSPGIRPRASLMLTPTTSHHAISTSSFCWTKRAMFFWCLPCLEEPWWCCNSTLSGENADFSFLQNRLAQLLTEVSSAWMQISGRQWQWGTRSCWVLRVGFRTSLGLGSRMATQLGETSVKHFQQLIQYEMATLNQTLQ